MPTSSPYWGFTRAFVCAKDRVYILAHLPELEESHIDVTQVIRKTDVWASFRVDWPCVALCAIDDPELTVFSLGVYGRIHVARRAGFSEEAVDTTDEGPAGRGDLRDICNIGKSVYVTGMGRQVYMRDEHGNWRRCDRGLVIPAAEARVAGFNSINGFSESDIYAVGWEGEIWHYDGNVWIQVLSPTNLKLQRVICVPPDTFYACGQAGVLLRGSKGTVQPVEQDVTDMQFWGMEWFQEKLWLSTQDAVYRLDKDDELIKVDLGQEAVTCGWLHACGDLMWSVGGQHLLSTSDGTSWTLEVVP